MIRKARYPGCARCAEAGVDHVGAHEVVKVKHTINPETVNNGVTLEVRCTCGTWYLRDMVAVEAFRAHHAKATGNA